MSALLRTTGVLFAVSALVSACRFEKRPDLETNGATRDTPYGPSIPLGSPVEDSVRAVLVAMNDAFGLGDGARVAQLTTRDAVLFDQDERVRWMRSDATAPLPPPLSGSADGFGWRLVESTFSRLSPDAALLSLRYQAAPSTDPLPRTAAESWVLLRTEAGWRVRVLHRSRGLAQSGSPP